MMYESETILHLVSNRMIQTAEFLTPLGLRQEH